MTSTILSLTIREKKKGKPQRRYLTSLPHLHPSYLLTQAKRNAQKNDNAFMHSSIFSFLDFLKKKKKLRQVPSYRVPSRIRIRIASPDANILHSADTCTCTYM